MAHGKGIMIYANRDTYEGLWFKGAKEGKGIYKHVDGSYYEGEWANDDKNGIGYNL